MFRQVVAIIRSLSFDILKSTLYNCVVVTTQLYKVLLSMSNDKDLMMATTCRNM